MEINKKRMLSVLLSGTLVLSLLSGCSSGNDQTVAASAESSAPVAESIAAADGLFKPGTYFGEGTGYGGALQVQVEVDADRILSVEVTDHKETPGIGDPALTKIPEVIIEHQSIAVDAVAGCTMASIGILEAVEAALTPACTDISALKKAVAKEAASGELIEKSTQVVIVGSGGAGMSAAVELVDAGIDVIIVEKMSSVGGNTLLAGSAMNAADPERQKAIEISTEEMGRIEEILAVEPQNDMMKSWQETLQSELDQYNSEGSAYLFDSPSLHKLQTYMDGDYVGNPVLIDIMGDHALESLEFLSDKGASWQDGISAAVGATWKRSHTPTSDFGTKGASFVLPQANYIEEKGIDVMLESRVEELIMEDGRCVGVKGATTSGQPFEIKADKAVLLATGGFGANVELRQKYNKHWPTLDESVETSNGPQATGDGIIMAEAVGASLIGMEWIQLIPTYGPGVFTPYIENQFYINLEGDRFVKEDGRRDELSQAALSQTDGKFYIMSDANTVVDGKSSTGSNVDERVGNGYIFKADTLEELAAQIGVPHENLQASVEQFNTSVKQGEDPYGRTVFDKEFGTAPFYAGLTAPMVHHTMGGIEINEKTQVLDDNGAVIPGLYAAGETIGGVHGSNRLGGNAIADVITFGRIAGQSIAEEK